MINLIRQLEKKFSHLIWTLISSGIIMLMLAILIVAYEPILRLLIGLMVLLLSYTFIYGGYRLWTIKKEVEKYTQLK